MADKLMQDVDEIESSSQTESVGPDVANEERMKKEEIMANLKHLNLLGNDTQAFSSRPSEVPEDVNSPISRKDNPSSPNSDGLNSGNNLNIIKEPSISSSSQDLDDNDPEEAEESKTLNSSDRRRQTSMPTAQSNNMLARLITNV